MTKIITFLSLALALSVSLTLASDIYPEDKTLPSSGPVDPSWNSLATHYHCPEWFHDAKFGIWAHWGPQSVPEQGDWFARAMYIQNHPD